jgi:hypothetical protein
VTESGEYRDLGGGDRGGDLVEQWAFDAVGALGATEQNRSRCDGREAPGAWSVEAGLEPVLDEVGL